MSLEEKMRSLLKELTVSTVDEKVSWLPMASPYVFCATFECAYIKLKKHTAEKGELCDWDNFSFVVEDRKYTTICEYIPQEKEKQRELGKLWNLVADLVGRPSKLLDQIMGEIHSKRGVRPAE